MSIRDYSTYEQLRRAYTLATNTRTDFVDDQTLEEWIRLAQAYEACEYDLTPDRWSPTQVRLAIACGTVPRFNSDLSPFED